MCAACAAGPTRVVRVAAPAKVNLYLGVHREPDERGYHLVDSVMASLGLADEVEVAPARELSVVCDPDAGCPARKNTCWKAVEAMDAEFGVGTGFDVQGAVTAVTDDAKALLPMDDLVDKAAETARLNKELANAQKQLDTVKAKLANEKFTSKAPQNVIDGVKANGEKLEAKIKLILETLESYQ